MKKKTKAQDNVTLELKTLLGFVDELTFEIDSKKLHYSTKSMLKLYLYMLIKKIKGFKTLHKHLILKPELLEIFGLSNCPHRITLSRRFKQLPRILREQIRSMHSNFVEQELTIVDAMSIDSSLMHAKGNVWHKKQRKQGIIPSCGNIDTDAHWGMSGCGEWVYGYRIHCLVSIPGDAALPYDVEVEAANIKDAKVFKDSLTSSLPEQTQALLGDKGFDDKNCYAICDKKEISLIVPLKAKKILLQSV